VEPSLAGPKRPQDRIPLKSAATTVGAALKTAGKGVKATVGSGKAQYDLEDGSVVIAAITSCTNTSNPAVMIGAGLVARNAAAKGLVRKPWVKTSLAPGSKVVTDYLVATGLDKDLDKVGFNLVGYGCTTCLVAGTPVLMANGMARRIEDLPSAGGTRVFGPTDNRALATAIQRELIPQGERDCVTLTLQDGRTLTCTPDHELLRADGQWVRADRLVFGKDRVVMGLEAPLDAVSADEAGYLLRAGQFEFSMANAHDRVRTLAFARLLGHLLSDGSISVHGQGRVNVGQALDRDAVLDDIELLTGKRPAGSRYDDRKWSIALPMELTQAITTLRGVQVGKRIDQPSTLPDFVLDARCPVAVVREFLGGLFGADGHSPGLSRQGRSIDDASLSRPAYSQSAKPEHVASLKQKMQHLIDLLVRCGVKAKGAKVYEYAVRRSASTYAPAQDGVPRTEIRLDLPEGLSFVERVGYRYCVDKQLRASAAAVYWRTIDTINRQRLRMADRLEEIHRDRIDLPFSVARELAAAELAADETPVFPHYSLLEGHDRFDRLTNDGHKFKPMHRQSCEFPSPAELFTQLGVRKWFTDEPPVDRVEEPKRYCVEKETRELPTFSLMVLDRRSAGRKPVYDIAVDGLNAFVAGGICVHNCIGNSGPLPDEIAAAIQKTDLVACSVLSGNRNFEGRIHPQVKMNFLASPPLVVAYALAGNMKVDVTKDSLGTGKDGKPVYLKDIWPSSKEIHDIIAKHVTSSMFKSSYGSVFDGDANWKGIKSPTGETFTWDDSSTYVKNPPYFEGMTLKTGTPTDIKGARVLASLGDSVTTDHISPAGNIAADSPAGKYLVSLGVQKKDFNSYGARRGNHEVMVRGTFANIRLKNKLVPGVEGNWTMHLPTGEKMSIYDASMKYQAAGTPLIVLAGKEYGSGSSRDWAAKGTALLGIRAVIAESYERIHRSNLIGMGVVPLQFKPGETAESLGLKGDETFDIVGLGRDRAKEVQVTATGKDGKKKSFKAVVRIDTPKEQDYFIHGGILQYVLRQLAAGSKAA